MLCIYILVRFVYIFFVVLGIELSASHMVGKYSFHCAIPPALDPYFNYEKIKSFISIEEQT